MDGSVALLGLVASHLYRLERVLGWRSDGWLRLIVLFAFNLILFQTRGTYCPEKHASIDFMVLRQFYRHAEILNCDLAQEVLSPLCKSDHAQSGPVLSLLKNTPANSSRFFREIN
jgi:hypothetical protein